MIMAIDVVQELKDFMESGARSCSMKHLWFMLYRRS